MRLMICAVLLAVMTGCAATGGKSMEFSSNTVSFGIVVSDINKSLAFYQDALGLVKVREFDVSAEMGGQTGLSDNKPFHVFVLQLADAPEATQVKLMQFADAPGVRPDNSFIHSAYGVRYLTIRVTDADAALTRAAKHGVKPLAKGPYKLGSGDYLSLVRDPDGNLIELIGPMKK